MVTGSQITEAGERTGADSFTAEEQVLTLPVEGMTCEGCATTVRGALGGLAGVSEVTVDLDRDQVVLRGACEGLDAERARRTLGELGYRVGGGHTTESAGDRAQWSLRELLVAAVLVAVAGTLLFQLSIDSFYGGGAVADARETFANVSAVGIGLGFLFGVVMAFAPITYAMAPVVMGYVTRAQTRSTADAARLSVTFVAGIVSVDVLVGAIFAAGGSVAITFFSSRTALWYLVATVILAALAALNLRVWRPRLPSFVPRMGEPRSGPGAFLLGIPFGLMACPGCTPLLLPVAVGVAATGNVLYGAAVMGAFALGRGIPLALLGTFTGAFEKAAGATRVVVWIERVVGLLLLLGATWFLVQFLNMDGFERLW